MHCDTYIIWVEGRLEWGHWEVPRLPWRFKCRNWRDPACNWESILDSWRTVYRIPWRQMGTIMNILTILRPYRSDKCEREASKCKLGGSNSAACILNVFVACSFDPHAKTRLLSAMLWLMDSDRKRTHLLQARRSSLVVCDQYSINHVYDAQINRN